MSAPWRMRYRFRLAKPFSHAGEVIDLELGGRPATLKARKGGQLQQATDVVLLSGGFETEAEARAFGERVRHALLTASVFAQLGIDVGDDKPTTSTSALVKKQVLEQKGVALLDDVHGLMVYSEEPKPSILAIEGAGTVTISPEKFLSGLKASFGGASHVPEDLEIPVELYCASCMETSQMARLILAVSAIEAMIGDESRAPLRPAVELALLDAAYETVKRAKASEKSRNAVLSTISNLRRLGVRRAGQKLVEARLPGEGTTFVKVYDDRGKIAHKHRRADRAKAAQSAHKATFLAGALIAALLRSTDVADPPGSGEKPGASPPG